jgi:hypothetical protein
MATITRSKDDCESARALIAKATGFPFPPREKRHADANRGMTLYQEDPISNGSVWALELPDALDESRLSGPERAELARIRDGRGKGG